MVLYKPNQIEADNIKRIRRENALSQEQLSNIINEALLRNGQSATIKPRTIQNYESGLYSIPGNVRKAIKEIFSVEIQEAPQMPPLREVFRERLENARRYRRIDAASLARLSKCPQYERFESGRCVPTVEHFARICDSLDVSADYLLGLKDSVENENPARRRKRRDENWIQNGEIKIRETFPKNLRRARLRKQLIPYGAAKITGGPAYMKYEKGQILPSLETLYRICKSLDVSADELLDPSET